MRRSHQRRAVMAGALVLLLTACGGGSETAAPTRTVAEDPTPTATSPATAAADASGATDAEGTGEAAVPASLDWQGTDLQGAAVSGGDLAGEDLVLWVWAPWCTVCNREAPDVAAVARQRGDDVRFVGVAGKDELAAHRGFVEDHGLEFFDHVADVDGTIWSHYGVGYQPAFVFIDADGTVLRVHAGAMATDELNAAIDELTA